MGLKLCIIKELTDGTSTIALEYGNDMFRARLLDQINLILARTETKGSLMVKGKTSWSREECCSAAGEAFDTLVNEFKAKTIAVR